MSFKCKKINSSFISTTVRPYMAFVEEKNAIKPNLQFAGAKAFTLLKVRTNAEATVNFMVPSSMYIGPPNWIRCNFGLEKFLV